MNKYYIYTEKLSKDLADEERRLLYSGDCSLAYNAKEGWLELIQIASEEDHLKTLDGFKQLGIELDIVKQLDPVKDIRLWNSIKSGQERQAEVEQFKLCYDKNNVGQVLDKMLEHSIAEQEAKQIAESKDLIIQEKDGIIEEQANQIQLAVDTGDTSGLSMIWTGIKTIVGVN